MQLFGMFLGTSNIQLHRDRKKPKVLGGAGSMRHRPWEAHGVGLLKGMLLIERVRSKSPCRACCTVYRPCCSRPAAKWVRCRRPCPGSSYLGPLVALVAARADSRMRIRGAILLSGIVRMLAVRGWLASGRPKNNNTGSQGVFFVFVLF